MVNTMIMMLATVGLGGPVTCGCGAGVHAERPEAVRSTAGSLDLDLGVGLGLGDPTLVVAPAPLPADVHLLESPDGPRTLSIVTADGTLELDLRAESVRTPRLEAAAPPPPPPPGPMAAASAGCPRFHAPSWAFRSTAREAGSR